MVQRNSSLHQGHSAPCQTHSGGGCDTDLHEHIQRIPHRKDNPSGYEQMEYAVGLCSFPVGLKPAGTLHGAALIGAVPMVIFFLVLQEYIVGGLTQGGVKE
jgi:hypothetical protein